MLEKIDNWQFFFDDLRPILIYYLSCRTWHLQLLLIKNDRLSKSSDISCSKTFCTSSFKHFKEKSVLFWSENRFGKHLHMKLVEHTYDRNVSTWPLIFWQHRLFVHRIMTRSQHWFLFSFVCLWKYSYPVHLTLKFSIRQWRY